MIGLLRGLTNQSTDYTTIAVLDNDTLAPLFESSHPMRVSVIDEKEPTVWQVETGEERSDHVVDKAIEVAIDFVLANENDVAQFNEMQDTYAGLKLVTIQTRMRSYENMLMQAMPHDETAEIGATVSVRFFEWREVTPEYGEPFEPQAQESKPTRERGRVSSQEAEGETRRKGSILSRAGIL